MMSEHKEQVEQKNMDQSTQISQPNAQPMDHSTNQSVSQPINQASSELTTGDLANQSTDQSTKTSTSQLTSRPHKRSSKRKHGNMSNSLAPPSTNQSTKRSSKRSAIRRVSRLIKQTVNPFHIAPANLTTHSPSLIDGISHMEEVVLRAESCDFLSQMGQICKISQWTIATACVYFHAFFSHFSLNRFDRFEVAACCLFLAGKVEERRIRVDQVIQAYFMVRLNHVSHDKRPKASPNQQVPSAHFGLNLPSPTSEEWEAFRQRIYALEFAVLDTVEFDFDLVHPYQNLMTFLRDVIFGSNYANMPAEALKKEIDGKGGLAQIAWLFINDSFRSTLCLRYPPDVVCIGVISLAIKFRKFEMPRPSGVPAGQPCKPWFEELFGLDLAAINDIERTVSESANRSYVPDYASADQLVRSLNLSPMPSLPPPRIVRPVQAAQPTNQPVAPSAVQSGATQSDFPSVVQTSIKKWNPRASKHRRSVSSGTKSAVIVPHIDQPVIQVVSQPMSEAEAARNCDEWDNELMPAAPTRTASPSSPSPAAAMNMSPLSCQASPSTRRKLQASALQGPISPYDSIDQQLEVQSTQQSVTQTSTQLVNQFAQAKVAVSLMPRFNLTDNQATDQHHSFNPSSESLMIGDYNSVNPSIDSFASHDLYNSTNPSIDSIAADHYHAVNPSIDSSIELTECGDWEEEESRSVQPPKHHRHVGMDQHDVMEHIMKNSDSLANQAVGSSFNYSYNPRMCAAAIQSGLALQMRSAFPAGQCSDRVRLNKRQRFEESASSPVTFC